MEGGRMKEVKFINRESQKDSLVIECDTAGGGGNIIALGDDKFAEDYADWDFEHTSSYISDIDQKVWTMFEFTEYEWLNKPSDLIGQSICVHDGDPMYPEDEITKIEAIYKVKDYFPYDELTKEEA